MTKNTTDAGIPTLIYHTISEDNAANQRSLLTKVDFELQMEWLYREGYQAISVGTLTSFLRGECELPSKVVAITFDDGCISAYHMAMPILQKYGFIATFFIVTDIVGLPERVSWPHLRQMVAEGMAIGSHTAKHMNLPLLQQDTLMQELTDSKNRLENELGVPCETLTYPFGLYNSKVKLAAREAGYLAAFGNIWGLNRRHDDLYTLRRIGINQGMDLSRFSKLIIGDGIALHSLLQDGVAMTRSLIGYRNFNWVMQRLGRHYRHFPKNEKSK